ncbi:hypothetical protein evm_010061 [Chilo suppressalis]|nr:hypothetical protein evm_010061 [Chilo suppressalis]
MPSTPTASECRLFIIFATVLSDTEEREKVASPRLNSVSNPRMWLFPNDDCFIWGMQLKQLKYQRIKTGNHGIKIW